MTGRRLTLTPAERARVLHEDANCEYCGQWFPVEVDHIVPVSRGGDNNPANLAAACYACNREKSDMTVEEWRQHRQRKGLEWPPPSRESILWELGTSLDLDHLRHMPALIEAAPESLIEAIHRVKRGKWTADQLKTEVIALIDA